MFIDFKELAKLIPDSGSLSLSVKRGKDNKLDILFRIKHDLVQLKNASAKGSDEGKQIEAATKLLDQPYAFSATAEELNASFEEKIKQPVESTKNLVAVISDRTKALEEAAKSIRTTAAKTKTPDKAKVPGSGDTASTKTTGKGVKEEPAIGNLFGSVGTEGAVKPTAGDTSESTGSPSADSSEQGEAADKGEEDSDLENVDEDGKEELREAA